MAFLDTHLVGVPVFTLLCFSKLSDLYFKVFKCQFVVEGFHKKPKNKQPPPKLCIPGPLCVFNEELQQREGFSLAFRETWG